MLPEINFGNFAGANWLAGPIERFASLSRLGATVADILGYTYQGIYHIDQDVLRNKSAWLDDEEVTLSLYSGLSTYDFPRLTLLVAACCQERVQVEIKGSRARYLRLRFTWASTKVDLDEEALILRTDRRPGSPLGQIADLTSLRGRTLYQFGPTDAPTTIAIAKPGFSFEELIRLTVLSHHLCVRSELEGICPTSLKVWLSERDPKGESMSSRHSTWDQVAGLIHYNNTRQ